MELALWQASLSRHPEFMTDSTVDEATEEGTGPATSGGRHGQAGPRKLLVVGSVAGGVVALDQLTKHWALSALRHGPINVVGTLRWNLLYNTGTAFSLGSGKGLGPWISILAISVVVALSLGYTSRFRLGAVAAGLIAGGAIGNLLDRAFRGDDGFLHGAVIDFVDLQWWPVFNVADAAICIGAGLLVLASFRAPSN